MAFPALRVEAGRKPDEILRCGERQKSPAHRTSVQVAAKACFPARSVSIDPNRTLALGTADGRCQPKADMRRYGETVVIKPILHQVLVS